MLTLFLRLVTTGVSIWVAAETLDGMWIVPPEAGFQTTALVLLGTALVFTAVNAIVKPVLELLSLPFIVLTLGLFLLLINALMLKLTAWITGFTDYGLAVEGFWTAVIGSVVISVVNWVLGLFVRQAT